MRIKRELPQGSSDYDSGSPVTASMNLVTISVRLTA
jgi:hypothetical protein